MLSRILSSNLPIAKNFNGFSRFFADAVKANEDPNKEYLSKDDIIYRAADKIIEERIRPVIKQDGGDVEICDVVDGTLIVKLSGACQGCKSKNSTLYDGILGLIKEEVPGVKGIREKLDFED